MSCTFKNATQALIDAAIAAQVDLTLLIRKDGLIVFTANQSLGGFDLEDVGDIALDTINAAGGGGSEIEVNSAAEDVDLRIQSDSVDDAIFVQGSNGFIGLHNDNPTVFLHGVGNQARFERDSDVHSSACFNLVVQRNRGGALLANDQIFQFLGNGQAPSGMTSGGKVRLRFEANENYTNSAQGSRITLYTTEDGTTSTTEKIRFHHNGNVSLSTTDERTNGPSLGFAASSGDVGSVATGDGAIYFKVVSGTTQFFVARDDGTVVQISGHPLDAPDVFYSAAHPRGHTMVDRVLYPFIGIDPVELGDLSRAGQTLDGAIRWARGDLVIVESFTEYAKRHKMTLEEAIADGTLPPVETWQQREETLRDKLVAARQQWVKNRDEHAAGQQELVLLNRAERRMIDTTAFAKREKIKALKSAKRRARFMARVKDLPPNERAVMIKYHAPPLYEPKESPLVYTPEEFDEPEPSQPPRRLRPEPTWIKRGRGAGN